MDQGELRRLHMTDRYEVPMSLPWRMPCVGSWFSQNVLRSRFS